MKIRSISKMRNVKGRRVLVRVDFNVPVENGKVQNTTRIEATLETLRFLIKKKARVIILTHFGRPNGKEERFSNRFLVHEIRKFLNVPVLYVNDCIGEKVYQKIDGMKGGDVLVLENTRFYKEEKENDSDFAQALALNADIYVNEAFSVSHRKHASVVGVPQFIPGYAGFHVFKEMKAIDKAIVNIKKPAVAVVGGIKISTKIEVLNQLLSRFSKVLVGGGIANTFLAAQNIPIGKSLIESENIKLAKKILKSKNKKKLVLPSDVVITRNLSRNSEIEILTIDDLKTLKNKNFYIVDIGPRTILEYAIELLKAETLIWNGPVGFFEYTNFSHGSLVLADIFAYRSKGVAYGVVGGGETIEVFDKSKTSDWVDFISTGGGAMLKYLEGKGLVGLDAIKLRTKN